jgi:CrcB protein
VRQLFIIGLGGFLGATGRYLVSGFAQSMSNSIEFPYGTLAVNVLGCFLIGLFAQLADTRGVFGPELRLFMFIGILGALTTFSTFSLETFSLLADGQSVLAGLNVGINLGLCLLAVWLGRVLVLIVWR